MSRRRTRQTEEPPAEPLPPAFAWAVRTLHLYDAAFRLEIPNVHLQERTDFVYNGLVWETGPYAGKDWPDGFLMRAEVYGTRTPAEEEAYQTRRRAAKEAGETWDLNPPNILPRWEFIIRRVTEKDKKNGALYGGSNVYDGQEFLLEIQEPGAHTPPEYFGYKRLITARCVAEAINAVRDILLMPKTVAASGQIWERENNGPCAFFNTIANNAIGAQRYAFPPQYPYNQNPPHHFPDTIGYRAAEIAGEMMLFLFLCRAYPPSEENGAGFFATGRVPLELEFRDGNDEGFKPYGVVELDNMMRDAFRLLDRLRAEKDTAGKTRPLDKSEENCLTRACIIVEQQHTPGNTNRYFLHKRIGLCVNSSDVDKIATRLLSALPKTNGDLAAIAESVAPVPLLPEAEARDILKKMERLYNGDGNADYLEYEAYLKSLRERPLHPKDLELINGWDTELRKPAGIRMMEARQRLEKDRGAR